MNDQKENNLSPILIGVAIGAALTYLFTTKKGKKIKTELLKDAVKMLEKLGEEIEENIPEVKEKITEASEEVKEKIEEVTEDIPKQVQVIQNKGRRFFFSKTQKDS